MCKPRSDEPGSPHCKESRVSAALSGAAKSGLAQPPKWTLSDLSMPSIKRAGPAAQEARGANTKENRAGI